MSLGLVWKRTRTIFTVLYPTLPHFLDMIWSTISKATDRSNNNRDAFSLFDTVFISISNRGLKSDLKGSRDVTSRYSLSCFSITHSVPCFKQMCGEYLLKKAMCLKILTTKRLTRQQDYYLQMNVQAGRGGNLTAPSPKKALNYIHVWVIWSIILLILMTVYLLLNTTESYGGFYMFNNLVFHEYMPYEACSYIIMHTLWRFILLYRPLNLLK